MKETDDNATILDIQRMSTEDGPGIRTTVFFKGCSLACLWCHNPESLSFARQVQWFGTMCIGCKTCIRSCPRGALVFEAGGLSILRDKCDQCFKCVDFCPSGAMEIKGTWWSLDNLVYEVLKDRSYFEKSGGGITVSGGDPLVQIDFTERFLSRLKEEGVHTAVDTAGFVSKVSLERMLPYTDLILYDLKLIDSRKHKKFTGADNQLILENAKFLAKYIKEHGRPEMWIRTPVIPGATDSDENIASIGTFITNELSSVVNKWELCAFNNLCRDKYKRLDMEWDFKEDILLTRDRMNQLTSIARDSCNCGEIVVWSGSVKVEV
jgi:pyruvate formate lyase activating enzyme